MNFRLSCTWCNADSTAPGPRCAEHRHRQPQTAATKSQHQLVCEISCSLPPASLPLLLPNSKAWQQTAPSNSGLCCTSTKTFALFIKTQLLKRSRKERSRKERSRKRSSFARAAGAWPQEQAGDASASSVRCWSLPVSCPSLPVDDAKARLFSAILRKWKILSGEIRSGKKASGAQCCKGHTANMLKNLWTTLLLYNFINLNSNRVRGYVGFQDFKQAYIYLCISAVLTAQAQHHLTLCYRAISSLSCHHRAPHLHFHTISIPYFLTSIQASQSHLREVIEHEVFDKSWSFLQLSFEMCRNVYY